MCYIGYILDRFHGIKRCTKCGHVRKHCRNKTRKDGLHTKCVTCVKQYNKEHYKANRDARLAQQKEYYEANRDAIRVYMKAYNEANRDAILAYQKEHYEANRDAILAHQKEYYEANRDARLEYSSKPETKQRVNARRKTRQANDPAYRARANLSKALYKFLKGSKNGRTFDLVGCTQQQLVEYLDRTMSQETRAALDAGEKIDIDHIVPQRAPGIDITNDAHVRSIYHYTNFQWLDKSTNIPKSNNVPDGYDTETWLVEQQARIEACRGMTPVDTIPMNAKMLADARTFANSFRR